MLTRGQVPYAATAISLLMLHSASSLAANCAPYPASVNLGNVTLDNTTTRGVSLTVGEPGQHFAFLPQWPLNHTIVFGIDGHCGDSMSEAACRTFRGGAYDESASQTHQDTPTKPYLTEASPYPFFSWGTDKLTLNSNTTLEDYLIGVPRDDWGEQGYHPQAAFGLGRNSTILNALYSAGHIASRSWAMFWGRTGATADAQQPGSFVFGGFDRAKTSGENYTDVLNYSNEDCPTGMLVTVTDLVLDFTNGTKASLFDGLRSSAMAACIVPDYPVLMTLPREPYFNKFQRLTNQFITSRSFGINYYGMVYDDPSEIYTGDLTITLSSGFSVRIPNDQLVIPDLVIDESSGALQANGSTPELVINSIQLGNADDLPQLGRQLLSSAYLMVNQDAGTYTFWKASLDTDEDLVAVDETNKLVDQFCSAADETPTSPKPSSPPKNDDDGLSKGAIAGIVVGCVAGVAIIAAMVFFIVARKKKLRKIAGAGPATSNPQTAYTGPRNELDGYYVSKPQIPQELLGKPVSRSSAALQELP
ncbi:hypothetical protein PHISCL_08440 [Aspergillus sclerotialis]|uniref:Peptidase A1 domain-containing protein n=1 Tax=Aspergillus sclerotialis TaxID=2070753 RepID=A0A3A2ZMX3_9EURO|nr:hypothetical protein PHISCL_08440 [Aspergillus sclerotialis]